ncbi:MAG: tetratricopeptide repeat protein [Chloroflexi bacterium]|nr:tetratricopeptide repeat protein [Chloroflexota bacterium]
MILQQRAHRETAYNERIAIWRSRVDDARTDEETVSARQGLHQAQNEYMRYLDEEVLQLAKEVVQDRASAGPITADTPKLPPADRESLETAASVVARLEPPKTFDDHFLQANAFYAAGDYDRALEQYDRALELTPDDPDALGNRGIALDDLQRHDEALSAHNRALELKPDDPNTRNNRGNTLDDLQRYDEALVDYNRSLELRPDHPGTLYNRACLYSLAARLKESLNGLREAISRDAKYRKMAREDEDFDNLRADPKLGPEFERLVAEPEN